MRIVPPARVVGYLSAPAVTSAFAQEVRVMSPDQAAEFEARLRNWAVTYYPAMVPTKSCRMMSSSPFLVDEKYVVLRHTTAVKTPRDGVPLPDELSRVFPGVAASALANGAGGCFLPKAGQPQFLPKGIDFSTYSQSRLNGRA